MIRLRTTALALILSTSAYAQVPQQSIDVSKAFGIFKKQREDALDAAAKAEMEKLFLQQELDRVKAELDTLKKPDEKK